MVFLAIVVLVHAIIGIMYRVGGYDSVWQNEKFVASFAYAGLFLILYPLLYLIYYKFLNRQNGLRIKDVFQKSRRSKGWIFKWTVITVGFSQLAGFGLTTVAKLLLGNNTPATLGESVISSKNDVLGFIIYGVPVVLLAPVFEELLFRATIYRNNRPMGGMFAAVVTGTAFGLWHTNINQVFMAAFFGVFLCLIYEKTKSITVVMFIHFVNNLLVFGLTFAKFQIGDLLNAGDKMFMVQAMFHTKTVFAILLTLLALVLVSACIAAPIMLIVQIVKKRKNLELSKGDFPYGGWKKALVFFSAPLTLIAFAAMIVLTFVI